MGVKRPLEEKDFPELSFKQPKQIDSDLKLTFTTDDLSSDKTSQTVYTPGETKSDCYKSYDEGMPENGDINGSSVAHKELEAGAQLPLAKELGASAVSPLATELEARVPLHFATELEASAPSPLATELEASAPLHLATELEAIAPLHLARELNPNASIPLATELEANTPLPLVTSSSSEEDSENEDSSLMYNFPGYVDLGIPWRPSEVYQDPYAVLLNSSPRKEVSVGPDHQAEVPQWDPSSSGKDFSEKTVDNDWEQKMIGTTVIPSPTSFGSSIEGGTMGHGRTACSCLDAGSMRCVQQHVMEAREKLRETIGEEAFTKMGFYDMGEEVVAGKWTAEDEQLFHEVVLANPASLGSDFWKDLSDAFPNRSKKELISYYFNVFMLQRRAVQNRSYLLQIDSDDDEAAHGDASLADDEEDTDDENVLNLNPEDFNIGGEEDDESAVESFDDEALDAGWADHYHLPNIDGKDDSSGTADTGNGDGNGNKQEGADKDAAGQEPKR